MYCLMSLKRSHVKGRERESENERRREKKKRNRKKRELDGGRRREVKGRQ